MESCRRICQRLRRGGGGIDQRVLQDLRGFAVLIDDLLLSGVELVGGLLLSGVQEIDELLSQGGALLVSGVRLQRGGG
jgi:hypothetical protein